MDKTQNKYINHAWAQKAPGLHGRSAMEGATGMWRLVGNPNTRAPDANKYQRCSLEQSVLVNQLATKFTGKPRC